MGDYIPLAPVSDEAKKHNQQLPGQGGVFNVVNFQLYHYAGNNPVKYTDPEGESLIAIAAAGFLIGAGVEIANQLIDNKIKGEKLDFSKLDGKRILIQGISGAASLLLSATGLGIGVQIAGNAVIGYLSDYATQIAEGKDIDGGELLASTITGAFAGLVGGAGNKEIGSHLKRLNKRISSAVKYGNIKEIGKAISFFEKNTKTLTKRFIKEAFKDAIRGIVPSKLLDDFVKKVCRGVLKDE